MKKRNLILTSLLLIIAIGNYIRIDSNSSVRAVEFVAIFAIGAFAGALAVQVFKIDASKNTTT